MDIAFRVCGYIGTAKNGGNQGRYGDVHDRVYHLGLKVKGENINESLESKSRI